jgi:hypothetical protein
MEFLAEQFPRAGVIEVFSSPFGMVLLKGPFTSADSIS